MRCRWLLAAVLVSPALAAADDVSIIKGTDVIEFKSPKGEKEFEVLNFYFK